MDSQERAGLAAKRLESVLRTYTVASARTLEQKISDAGPFGQRIDPHVLTPIRRELERDGVIAHFKKHQTQWYYLTKSDNQHVKQKLDELVELHKRAYDRKIPMLVGQALEIAVQRSLESQKILNHFGRHEGIDDSDDSSLYTKEEPPSDRSGRKIEGKKKLDFLIEYQSVYGGIEVKNTREWLYPNRDEIKEMLLKCCQLNVVPILIARRIPFVTFKLLNACGAIVHQTYRQQYPSSEAELAGLIKDKNLFGFHDVVIGNQPDARMNKFIHANLPKVLIEMKPRFDDFHDLTSAYGNRDIEYKEFAARVRRRVNGKNEDSDREPDSYDV